MTISARRRSVRVWLLAAAATVIWVRYVGAVLLFIGAAAVSDPRCEKDAYAHPQLNPSGIPLLIGAALLWAAPFIGVAVARPSAATITLAGAAGVVSACAVSYVLTHPSPLFCI
ncbi:hypothetical protein ACIP5Y_04435 [Nocardia sp. NPDC088792]|uniref:hypothetical protein n=1 Tax=Nocardia sp. NPDC088792 TaxID=3364332 RepID=UPI003800B3B2